MKPRKLKIIHPEVHTKFELYNDEISWKLIIRGHIRNAFENRDLYNLVKCLHICIPKVRIYMHTWNRFSNNISWRTIEKNDEIVTNEIIDDYFDDLKHLIHYIIIEDDNQIELLGKIEGNVANSKAPLLGWKNYWYGKHQINKYIHNENPDNDEMVINLRFDVLDCPSLKVNIPLVVEFVRRCVSIEFSKLKFVKDDKYIGLDNLYAGTIKHMYALSYHFVNNLDNITEKHPDLKVQEHLVFYENETLFNS